MRAPLVATVLAAAAVLVGPPVSEYPARLGLAAYEPAPVCADYGDGSPPVCDQYELPEWDSPGQPDPVADCLWRWGWRGLPDDGHESLYAPRSVIELAAQRCSLRFV